MPGGQPTLYAVFILLSRVLEAKVVVHIFFSLSLSGLKEKLLRHTHGIFPELQIVTINGITHHVSIGNLSSWSTLAVQRDLSVRLQLEED